MTTEGVRIRAILTSGEVERLRQHAKRRHVSLQAMGGMAIVEWLERKEREDHRNAEAHLADADAAEAHTP